MCLAMFVPSPQMLTAQVVTQDTSCNPLPLHATLLVLKAIMKSQQITLVLHVIHHAQIVQEDQILNAQAVIQDTSCSPHPPLARQLVL